MSDLPMNRERAQKLTRWLKHEFGAKLAAAMADTAFSVDTACAIVCKETGIYLVDFVDKVSANEALARCVFDASGDAPGTSRSAFPKNGAQFRKVYGDDFADMLIAEANKTRSLRGMDPSRYVYKGYGLFQYDLQHVEQDELFFRERRWGDFDECLRRLRKELLAKFEKTGNKWRAIEAYNGSGPKAIQYRTHVEQLEVFCAGA